MQGDSDVAVYGLHLEEHLCQGWLRAGIPACDIRFEFFLCSHEIKRCLLLGRKDMTNLDSILKSRDITLQKKVHIVKAMAFPVVMYGCKLSSKELMLLNCGVGEDS